MSSAGVPGLVTWLAGNGCRLRACVLAVLAALGLGALLTGEGRAQTDGFAYAVELEGEIDNTRMHDLERVLAEAEKQGARLVILRLDTPGGELETTRAMTRALLAAPVPVVVYVAPDGARAGSAGVFLTMAADVAAMAPQTNIGSASPILIGPDGVAEAPPTLYRKIVNDAAAYVRTLAESHRRNAELAERMVRRATNVTAHEALREGLIDVVAQSDGALLARLDGFQVKGAKAQVLRTAGLRVVDLDLSALADGEDPDLGGDGTLLLGLGLPGLIFLAMLSAVIVLLARHQLARRPRRRLR
jgi:membrane-bound serine protease (ClpP class)